MAKPEFVLFKQQVADFIAKIKNYSDSSPSVVDAKKTVLDLLEPLDSVVTDDGLLSKWKLAPKINSLMGLANVFNKLSNTTIDSQEMAAFLKEITLSFNGLAFPKFGSVLGYDVDAGVGSNIQALNEKFVNKLSEWSIKKAQAAIVTLVVAKKEEATPEQLISLDKLDQDMQKEIEKMKNFHDQINMEETKLDELIESIKTVSQFFEKSNNLLEAHKKTLEAKTHNFEEALKDAEKSKIGFSEKIGPLDPIPVFKEETAKVLGLSPEEKKTWQNMGSSGENLSGWLYNLVTWSQPEEPVRDLLKSKYESKMVDLESKIQSAQSNLDQHKQEIQKTTDLQKTLTEHSKLADTLIYAATELKVSIPIDQETVAAGEAKKKKFELFKDKLKDFRDKVKSGWEKLKAKLHKNPKLIEPTTSCLSLAQHEEVKLPAITQPESQPVLQQQYESSKRLSMAVIQ